LLVDGRRVFDPSALANGGFGHRTVGIGATLDTGALSFSPEAVRIATS
jgi:hypothetical protein